MYSVSNDYLDKITSSSREVSWYGSIKLASGTIVTFDTSNIASGGLSVNYDVSSDENPSIGNAFAGELRLNLYTDIDRYSLYGAQVTAYFRLYLTENTYEDVPLGVFYITEAERTTNMVSIVAYDGMTKLDSVKVAEDKSGSYPYEWIKAVVERGGLQLGNTSAEIGAMPNGNEQITFTQNSDPITSMSCRDALGYLSAVVCANAFIGRDGKVYIKGYDDAEVATIGADGRFSSSIADYTTRYTAVSLTISSTNATEYYAEATDDGLTFALGTNPFLQSGSSAEHETVCRNILNGLSVIEYVPFSMGLPVRPELDIMDVLMLTGNQATSSIGAITSLDFSSSGSMNVECTGANPLFMGVKTKAEKTIQQINNTVAKEINQMSVVQNSSSVTCGENTETSILTYNFEVTQEENTTMVDVSVVMTSSASETEVDDVYTLSDIVAHLSFYVDGSEISVYSPEFIVDEGKDTMTFNYSLSGLSVGAHQFDVRLTVDGGSGSIAVGDVHEMLWGYGITFEVYVKSIAVTSLPDITTVFVGQNLDFAGLEVDAVYNNGLSADVTAQSTYYPTEGTQVSEDDIGTYPISVSWNGSDGYFDTEFDMEVRSLYQVLRQNDNHYLWSSSGSSIDTEMYYREINGQVYAFSEKTTWASTSSFGIALKHLPVSFDADMRPSTPFYIYESDITEYFSYSGYYASKYAAILVSRYWVGDKWFAFPTEKLVPSAGTVNPVSCYDPLTDTATDVPVTITADGISALTNSTIKSLTLHTDGYKDMLQSGAYICFPYVSYSYTDAGSTVYGNGQAYMELNDSGITLRIIPNAYTARKRGAGYWVGMNHYENNNNLLFSWDSASKTMTVWEWTFDTTNLIQYTAKYTMTFADAPTNYNESRFSFLYYGGNKEYYEISALFSSGNFYWMYGATDGEDFELDESLTPGVWFAPQGVYIYMELDSSQFTKVWLHYSKDLMTWKKALALMPSSEVALSIAKFPDFAYGEYLLTHTYGGVGIDDLNRATTIVFEEDIS